jgi:biotin transport system substrate-specific component
LAYAAAGVALLAVCSWVTLPVGAVPFTLQTLAIAILVVAFPPALGTLTVAVWIILAMLGMPVLSGFTGSLYHVIGPTGGYLLGFLIGVPLGSALIRHTHLPLKEFLGVFLCLVCSHVLGVAVYAFAAQMDLAAAFVTGSLQFILPDLAKGVIGVLLGRELIHAVPALARLR